MFVGALWIATILAVTPPPAPGLKSPTGFVVTEFAGSTLANDILCMTVDPHGRIVVAGKGYIRVLVDDDGDGQADRAIALADQPREGAQGMLWEGNSLYVVGDGGLRRFRIDTSGERVVGPPELIRAARTGGEHDSHALRRGPDGWLYWLLGNNAGVNASFARLPTSPIRQPIAGAIVRFPPDFQGSEIVADGFRNAYDMDFNGEGDLFTFDSDNERCVSLPWYEGTRFYHVIPGGHHGWLNPQRTATWRIPPSACDVTAPVLDLGRGSPTGVVCYRQDQFPARYRGGFFLCDWTFGRVYFVTLKRQGSSYEGKSEVFLECVGDEGFAPTAAVVQPRSGDLFIAIGGRGTRGGVYRIRYTGAAATSGKPSCRRSSAAFAGSTQRGIRGPGRRVRQRRSSTALRRLACPRSLSRPAFSRANPRCGYGMLERQGPQRSPSCREFALPPRRLFLACAGRRLENGRAACHLGPGLLAKSARPGRDASHLPAGSDSNLGRAAPGGRPRSATFDGRPGRSQEERNRLGRLFAIRFSPLVRLRRHRVAQGFSLRKR